MIDKILNLIGFGDTKKRVEELISIDGRLSEINEQAISTSRKNAEKEIDFMNFSKSDHDPEVLKTVSKKYAAFKKCNLDNSLSLIKERGTLIDRKRSILSNEKINKAYKEHSAFSRLKELRTLGEISKATYAEIMKAKVGVVKYADTIVMNEEGKILILQRDKNDENGEKWVIPGGHVDHGEDFQEAAKRELLEESGVACENPENIGEYKKDGVHIEYFKTSFNSKEDVVILENTETQDYKWVCPYKDLDKFEFPFNMKENIKKILNIKSTPKEIIKALIENGEMSIDEIRDIVKAEKQNTKVRKIALVMKQFKDGKLKSSSGETVTDKRQALAIAMSEAGLNKGEEELENKIDQKLIDRNVQKSEEEAVNNEESQEIEKSDTSTPEYLNKMIDEHERLIKILEPHAEMDKKVLKELSVQKQELAEYKKKLEEASNKESDNVEKAEYEGREVELNKPTKGDVKKYKVYVRDPETGNIRKVEFGDPNMEIKRDDPERRKNFRARHNCSEKKDITSAGYWSCKLWSSKPVSEIVKGFKEGELYIEDVEDILKTGDKSE